ncbi:MAG: tetratricopeptide repeat protein [Pseudomonadota bacterium]|nr:tetratricopeptide repeat protein [Pseudomonadota bacterium]
MKPSPVSDNAAFTQLANTLSSDEEISLINAHYKVAKETQNIAVAEQGLQIALSQNEFQQATKMSLLVDDLRQEGHPSTTLYIIHALLNSKEYPAAVNATTALIRNYPTASLRSIAELYVTLPMERVNYLGQLNQRAPETARAQNHWAMITRIQLLEQQLNAAQDSLNKALRVYPNASELEILHIDLLEQQGKNTESEDALEQLIAQRSNDQDVGLYYIQKRLQQERIDDADRFAQTQTSHPDAYYQLQLAALMNQADRPNTAKSLAESALDGLPDRANLVLAEIDSNEKQYESAIAYAEKVPAQSDFFYDAQVLRLSYLAQLKRFDEAEALIEQLYNDFPMATDDIATMETRLLMKQEKNLEAIALYSLMMKRQPQNVDLIYERGVVGILAEYDELFIQDMQKVIELNPYNADALNSLGYYYADKNIKLGEAEQLINDALAIEPTSPMYLDSLGWLRFRQGRITEAKELIENVYEQLKYDPEVAAHLGEIYWVTGEPERAKQVWSEALKQSDDRKTYLLDTLERLGVTLEDSE